MSCANCPHHLCVVRSGPVSIGDLLWRAMQHLGHETKVSVVEVSSEEMRAIIEQRIAPLMECEGMNEAIRIARNDDGEEG